MRRSVFLTGRALVLLLAAVVLILGSCSKAPISQSSDGIPNDSVVADYERHAVIVDSLSQTHEHGAEPLSTSLPVHEVSDVFGFTFAKQVAQSSLAGAVSLFDETKGSTVQVSVWLSSDLRTLYVKPIFRFFASNGSLRWSGLKPARTYRIEISGSLRFTDGTMLGSTRVYRFQTKDLDYGIYWFASDGTCEKFVPGRSNPYFDRTKPSVIYIHGWQKGATQNDYERENPFLLVNQYVGVVNTGTFWKSRGFNVGIFYWSQFADENEVKDAEAKLWAANNGFKGMRYRLENGSYVNFALGKSVGDLAYETFVANFQGYSGGEIRILGHSLGNQLATILTYRLHSAARSGAISSSLVPSRLVLLDPFWSKDGKSYLAGRWTGEVCRNYVREMITQRGMAVEMYKSSMIGGTLVGDENDGMKSQVAFFRLWADFINQADQASHHYYAVGWYLWSMQGAVPGEGGLSFGAAISNSAVKNLMNWDWSRNQPISSPRMWYTEGAGNRTYNPGDDYFKQKSGVDTWGISEGSLH